MSNLFITNPDPETQDEHDEDNSEDINEHIDEHHDDTTTTFSRPRNTSQSSVISPRLQLSAEHVLTLTPGSILTISAPTLAAIAEEDLEWQSTAEERLCLSAHAGDLLISRDATLFLHADLHIRGSIHLHGHLSAENDADVSIDGALIVAPDASADFSRGGRLKIGGAVRIPPDARMQVRSRESLVLMQRKPGVFVTDDGVVRRASQLRRRERFSLSTAMHMRTLRQWASDSLESSQDRRLDRRLQSRMRAVSSVGPEERELRSRPAARSTSALDETLRPSQAQGPPSLGIVQERNRRPRAATARRSVFDEIVPEYEDEGQEGESGMSFPYIHSDAMRCGAMRCVSTDQNLINMAKTVAAAATPMRTPSTRTLAPPSYVAAVRASSAGNPNSLHGTPVRPPPYTQSR